MEVTAIRIVSHEQRARTRSPTVRGLSALRRMLMVVKMRSSKHSIDMREYQVTSKGIVIGERLQGYSGLTTGIPGPWDRGERTAASRIDMKKDR